MDRARSAVVESGHGRNHFACGRTGRVRALVQPAVPADQVSQANDGSGSYHHTLLVTGLEAGQWQPGQPIPSETELAARFGVSQGTVRKAIDEMAAENLLVRRQGKGTFVATHAEHATQYRFLRLMPDDGSASALQRRLLECRRMRALADGKPVVLDDLWLPGTAFKGLTMERLEAWRGPLYRLFEAEFAVRMIRAEEKIRAVAAAPEEAALFGVAAGAPMLSVERLSYTYGDRPVELRRGLYHTAAHHYRNELG